jgi:DNA-binding response OmpR family regulator
MNLLGVALVVDNSDPTLQEQKNSLKTVGIDTFRVSTMNAAITRIVKEESYRCVIINEDSVQNFWDLLELLCAVARIHVFITTHSFSKEKQTEAMRRGADAYVMFGETVKVDADCCVQHLRTPCRRAYLPVRPFPVLYCSNIVLSEEYHSVFVGDTEAILTRKEFDILRLFMSNVGIVLTFEKIYREVWGVGHEDNSHKQVWNHVYTLRIALKKVDKECNPIVSISGVGYRFISKCNQ